MPDEPPRSGTIDFTERVHAVVRRVPVGRIVSYGAVAALLGRPRAARGVGRALSALPDASDVPWWRVVNRNGAISLPGGAPKSDGSRVPAGPWAPGALQRRLLESEGVRFDAAGRASWKRHGWQPDESEMRALAALGEEGPPVKRSVSVLVRGVDGEVLLVQRPPDDDDLPDVWGLPAASLRAGETWRGAARRAGRDKLGVRLRPIRELRHGRAARESYVLEMKLLEAVIVAGAPAVPQRVAGVTQYRALAWGDLARLRTGAARGSLCCRLALEAQPPQ